jgi:hypothetical protein
VMVVMMPMVAAGGGRAGQHQRADEGRRINHRSKHAVLFPSGEAAPQRRLGWEGTSTAKGSFPRALGRSPLAAQHGEGTVKISRRPRRRSACR